MYSFSEFVLVYDLMKVFYPQLANRSHVNNNPSHYSFFFSPLAIWHQYMRNYRGVIFAVIAKPSPVTPSGQLRGEPEGTRTPLVLSTKLALSNMASSHQYASADVSEGKHTPRQTHVCETDVCARRNNQAARRSPVAGVYLQHTNTPYTHSHTTLKGKGIMGNNSGNVEKHVYVLECTNACSSLRLK